MVTVIGIFDIDKARGLDQAVERLAAAGFDDTVYNEAIVPEDAGNVAPVFVPGTAPPVVVGSINPDSPHKSDLRTIVRAFRTHLTQYHLPDEVIAGYATTFYRNGKFVLVRTDTQRAEQVIDILHECGASRVNRHD
jgi:hypothetical protein